MNSVILDRTACKPADETAYLEVMMRWLLLAVTLVAVALTAQAQEPDRLQDVHGPTAPEVAAALPDPTPEPAPPQRFSLDLELSLEAPQGSFDPTPFLQVGSEREYRAMLWSDPLARARYSLAAEQAMLGREGLVHGGFTVGAGLGNAVLGDASAGGAQLLLNGTRWSELSGRERVQVGFQVAVSAGILWALANGLGHH